MVDKISAVMNDQFNMPVKPTSKSEKIKALDLIKTGHDDLHSGNIYLDYNPETKQMEAGLIDFGGAWQRTNRQLVSGINRGLDMMFGNTERFAENILASAGHVKPKDAIELTNYNNLLGSVTKDLDESLIRSRANLKANPRGNTEIIEEIMDKYNLKIHPDEYRYLMSQVKAIMMCREVMDVTGTRVSGKRSNKNLADSLKTAFDVNKPYFVKTFGPTLIDASRHPQDALRISYQFLNDPADEAIKQQMIDGVIPHKNPVVRNINNLLNIQNLPKGQ